MPATPIKTAYNQAAQAILREQALLPPPEEENEGSNEVAIRAATVLDAFNLIQYNHDEGRTDVEVYTEQINSVLKRQLKDDLPKELATLYPQLFGTEQNDLMNENFKIQEELEKYKELHTRHVLPVLKGLTQQTKEEVRAKEELGPDHRPNSMDLELSRIYRWRDVAMLLSECYRLYPLQFPHAVVAVLCLNFSSLVAELQDLKDEDCQALESFSRCISDKRDAADPGSRQVDVPSHLEAYQSVLRTACSMLKADGPLGSSSDLLEVRRALKMAFYNPHTVTRRSLADTLAKFEAAVQGKDLASFLHRLLFKISLSHSVAVCQAIAEMAGWIASDHDDGDDKITIKCCTAPMEQQQRPGPSCVKCGRACHVLCVGPRKDLLKSVQCVCCSNRPGQEFVVWRVESCDDQPPTDPLEATHWLAHKRNVWETKPGIRTVVMPDRTQIVMATKLRETSTVQTETTEQAMDHQDSFTPSPTRSQDAPTETSKPAPPQGLAFFQRGSTATAHPTFEPDQFRKLQSAVCDRGSESGSVRGSARMTRAATLRAQALAQKDAARQQQQRRPAAPISTTTVLPVTRRNAPTDPQDLTKGIDDPLVARLLTGRRK